MRGTTFLACWLAATAARAQLPAEAEARRSFALGVAATHAGRHDDALAHYRESYRKFPRPTTLFNIARSEELLGDLETAYRDYEQVLADAPAEHPTHAAAEARLAELRKEVRATVQVRCNVAGAAVSVDGDKASAKTPALLKLSPGHHRLRVSAARADEKEVEVDASVGRPAAIDVELQVRARVELVVEPSDAEIEFGERRALGHLAIELPPGKHPFAAHRDGFADTRGEIDAGSGESIRREIVLHRALAPLSVRSDPNGAAVFVDGLPVGATPLRTAIPAGAHVITVEERGRSPWRGQFDAHTGTVTTIAIRLATPRSNRMRWSIWGLAGAGVAAGIAGGVMGAEAIGDYSEVARTGSRTVAERGEQRALIADVLLGTGGATLIAAAILQAATGTESEAQVTQGTVP